MTAIAVAVEDAAFVIDRDLIEIQQVAVAVFAAATLLPNAGMVLDGIVRRGVNRYPGAPLVVGGGDIGIPDALEISILVRAAGRIGQIGPDKPTGSTSSTATYGLVLRGVLNAMADTDVGVTNPLYSRAVSF